MIKLLVKKSIRIKSQFHQVPFKVIEVLARVDYYMLLDFICSLNCG